MAKDPAFLFYPGDWLGGTMTFSRSHKGAYMDLLMVQFNNGHMSLSDVEMVLGNDFGSMWELKLKAKFKQDSAGLFYNQKLEDEVIKRKNFSESRRKNLNHKKGHMEPHMENENENENKDVNGKENKKSVEKKKQKVHPEFSNCMEVYFNFMKTQTGASPRIGPADGRALKEIINYLEKFPGAQSGEKSISQLFEYILVNIKKWDAFHQKGIKLLQINSNLENIINRLKNGNPSNSKDYFTGRLSRESVETILTRPIQVID